MTPRARRFTVQASNRAKYVIKLFLHKNKFHLNISEDNSHLHTTTAPPFVCGLTFPRTQREERQYHRYDEDYERGLEDSDLKKISNLHSVTKLLKKIAFMSGDDVGIEEEP